MKFFKKKKIKKILTYIIFIFHPIYSYSFSNIIFANLINKKNAIQIQIKSTNKLTYYYFLLSFPKRIVIDIKNITINKQLKNIEKKINFLYFPNLKPIHIKQFDKKTVRLVFKNNQKIKFSISNFQKIKKSKYSNKLKITFYTNEKKRKKNLYKKKFFKKKILIKKKTIIMIDPGHGGEDSGAIGKNNTLEKEITLKIALQLKKLINNNYKMKAYITRYNDTFISLKKRKQKTREKNAQLFISIHTNSFTNIYAKGSSVFILKKNKKTKKEKKKIKKKIFLNNKKKKTKNNKTITIKKKNIKESTKLGLIILKEIKKINNLHKNFICQENFAVLKNINIPSVLIETAFISNPKEENKLKTEKFQKKIAKSIFLAIKIYLKKTKQKQIK